MKMGCLESYRDDVLLMNAFERIQTKGAQCHR